MTDVPPCAPEAPTRAEALGAFLRDASGAVQARVPALDLPVNDGVESRIALEVELIGGRSSGPSETLSVVVELAAADASGLQAERLAIVEAARAAGAPVPEPLWACDDPSVLGRPFHVLRAAPGERASALEAGALGALGSSLARLHGVRPPWPGLENLEDPGASVGRARVEQMRRRLDRLGRAQPALEWVLRWLERRAPRFDEVVLGHGRLDLDACRVDGGALIAIERWTGARWGQPAEDIARLCLAFDDGAPGGAQPALDALVAGYREESGREPERDEMPFWLLVAAAERAVDALERIDGALRGEGTGAGPRAPASGAGKPPAMPDRSTPGAVLEAFARAEALRRVGASVNLYRLGRARRAVTGEILSGLGSAPPPGNGVRHLEALYGESAVEVDLSRFARDVRDGVFDGACAQGARVVIVEWLQGTLAADAPAAS